MTASAFYATCLGGLETIVAAELAGRVPEAEVVTTEFGRVHFRYAGPVGDLLGLRTIEHVAVTVGDLGEVRPEASWLEDLEQRLAETDLGPALALRREVATVPERPRFRVSAVRTGRHEFASPQAAGMAGSGIVARYGWPVDLENYEVDVRLEIRQDRGLIGMRLSDAALHHRSRVVHMRASLNPTMAAAMTWVSTPTRGELVLDPMCGAGTLLTERHQHDPDARLVGGDLYGEKVAMARENFRHFGVPAQLVQADAQQLPFASGVVDKVLCNLPWGRVVANPRINRRLYPALLGEIARVLRPGGQAVLLTSERNLFTRVLARMDTLRLEGNIHVHIGGLEPSLYTVRRG